MKNILTFLKKALKRLSIGKIKKAPINANAT